MIRIQTPADVLFKFIEIHSPVKENRIPKQLKNLKSFENHLRVLETNGMIEVQLPLFSGERIFIFKSKERSIEYEPWSLPPFRF